MNFTAGWHVLYVKSRWEKKVYESLIDIALEAFLPQIKIVRQWSDRKKVIQKPMFPSYLFVNVNSALEFQKVLSVKGACSYIGFGKEYARVTEREINLIKVLIENKNITDLETDVQPPEIGEIRKITCGPLRGFNCEVLNVKSKRKVIVRIDSLKQSILATVPLDFIN